MNLNKSPADRRGKWPLGWMANLLSGREIDKRVDEDFPTWHEFSTQKLQEAEAQKNGVLAELPAHKVYISSPLQWNFIYFLLVTGSLAMGWAQPDWAPVFIYGAVFFVFAVALFGISRDGIFFHLEGQRLEGDAEMINRNVRGPETELEEEDQGGFLQSLTSKKKTLFRSKLMQIHYQNVLRTFEQGNRRTWVNQESSISDIQILVSQRGMKLAWTLIEVLPQLGLLGTLIGLARMFLAFRAGEALPEVSIIAGFGTALGTTILANLFVLMLRPLYMRNERAMNEILSTLQMLMATFILPTQQSVLDRSGGNSSQRAGLSLGALSLGAPSPGQAAQEKRVAETLEGLTKVLDGLGQSAPGSVDGKMGTDTNSIGADLKALVRSLQDSVNPVQANLQQQALTKLTDSIQGLSKRLDSTLLPGASAGAPVEKMEHDLMQVRMLNRDTLVLLDQISTQIAKTPGEKPRLLSANPDLRTQVFPEQPTPEKNPSAGPRKSKTKEPAKAAPASVEAARLRAFKEQE